MVFTLTHFFHLSKLLDFYQLQLAGKQQQYNNIKKSCQQEMRPKRGNTRINDNEQDSQMSQNSTSQRCLQNYQIEELYSAYRRMKAFSEEEDNVPFEKLEQLIMRYCGRTLNFDISPKNVLDILDKRIERMLKNKKYKKNWSEEDTKILLWTFCKYGHRNGIKCVDETRLDDWVKISALIPGSHPDSCMFKVLSLKKVKLSQKKWTQIEESLLQQIVKKQPKRNWRVISQKLFKANSQRSKIFRNAKQCKQHWVCYLNPDLKKGPWDPQEDHNLMDYVFVNNGIKKWAQIAKVFKGRTQNALKNRYTLIIERMRKDNPTINNELQLIQMFLKRLENRQNSSNSNRRSIRSVHQNRIREVENSSVIVEDRSVENRNREIRAQQVPENTALPQNYTMIFPQMFHNGINYYPVCFSVSNCFWPLNSNQS